MIEDIDNKEPGRSLARARQEKNLTKEEVAARLHLSTDQIRSLEENDYELLPEATYIKGYIRNYARLLGIDPATLVASYIEREKPKDNEIIETVIANQKKKKMAEESKVKYATFMIVALVVVVIAIWIGNQDGAENNAKQPIKSTANSDQISSDELFGPGPDVQPEKNQAAEAVEDIEKKITTEQEPQYPAAPQKINALNTPDKETTVKRETEQKKETLDVLSTKESVKAKQGNKAEKSKQVQKEQIDELVLSFEQNSWADIRDANEKKLLYKTISEGSVVSVKGVSPFKIFLGNADGVKLSYNGKQINFDQYKRGLIARFTVGRQ